MAFYSFVQFISVVIIYWRSSIPSDTEYLYVDLLIIDVIALTATRNEGRTEPMTRIFRILAVLLLNFLNPKSSL